jgi:hypothetical protein
LTEGIISVLFSFEFLIRVVSCHSVAIYMKDLLNIIDFCACIPYWIELFTNGFDAKLLRVVRVVRILRLFRLSKLRELQDILNIYINTFKKSIYWLIAFAALYCVVLVIVSSLAYVAEVGEATVSGICDLPGVERVCKNISSPYKDFHRNLTSESLCYISCEKFIQNGCCSYEPWKGSCRFYRSTAIENSTLAYHISSGICRKTKSILRRDGTITPFSSITESMWWSHVTLMLLGYGEVLTITEFGRSVGALTSLIAAILLFVPVSVVGYNFTVAIV